MLIILSTRLMAMKNATIHQSLQQPFVLFSQANASMSWRFLARGIVEAIPSLQLVLHAIPGTGI
jgi:hypothetical protein